MYTQSDFPHSGLRVARSRPDRPAGHAVGRYAGRVGGPGVFSAVTSVIWRELMVMDDCLSHAELARRRSRA